MAEVESAPVVAKRMWSYLRAVFFMMRKGVLSKRKLLLSMHLVMKRRNKAVASFLGGGGGGRALRRRDYEFSCSNSPDPGSFSFSSRRRLAYFPCLGADAEASPCPGPASASAAATAMQRRIEYYAAARASPAPSSPGLLLRELAPGEEYTPPRSPLIVPSAGGGFSVRVSNYSSEEEGGDLEAVDDDAEEFISRFYEQLRRQNQIALLPYLPESAA